jgi:hypothetical protein
MSVRCAKCGEELLGAVNRCWKCGQIFARRPEIDGLPPVRMERPAAASEPIEAIVLDDAVDGASGAAAAAPVAVAASPATGFPLPPPPVAPVVQYIPKPIAPPPTTSEMIEARRYSLMAMGGTVGALVLGIFAVCISPFWFGGAFVGLLGMALGIWGLYSPRRGWALAGVLLCCLGIALGAYRGARDIYIIIQKNQPVEIDEPVPDDEAEAP